MGVKIGRSHWGRT